MIIEHSVEKYERTKNGWIKVSSNEESNSFELPPQTLTHGETVICREGGKSMVEEWMEREGIIMTDEEKRQKEKDMLDMVDSLFDAICEPYQS